MCCHEGVPTLSTCGLVSVVCWMTTHGWGTEKGRFADASILTPGQVKER